MTGVPFTIRLLRTGKLEIVAAVAKETTRAVMVRIYIVERKD